MAERRGNMLLTKEVEITPSGKDRKRYEELGYKIPLHWDEPNKKWAMPRGTKIKIKVEDLSQNSHLKIECQCDNCGKITQNSYKDYITHNHNGLTYCNLCKSKIFMSGEKNYRWRSDISIEERRTNEKDWGRYYDLEHHDFIRGVLNRDNYKCVVCGSKEKLCVHHLDGWNWCTEKRRDINNGVTLCYKCHRNFHGIYGNGNNTKEQFEEWYGNTLEFLANGYEITSTRKIICLDNLEVYNSAKDCAIKLNLNDGANIYKSAKNVGENSYCGMYFMYYDEYIKKTSEELEEIYRKCKHHTEALKRNMTFSNIILDLNNHIKYRTMKNLAKSIGKGSSFVAYKIDNKQEWNGCLWVREKDYDGDSSDFVKVGDDW